MQILEVKNDIAKITYNPMDNRLLPSDFLLIEDSNQKLIAQIINIETTEKSDEYLAILRLALTIDKEDNLSFFNGYIPSKTSKLIYITPDEIVELIKGSDKNIYLGNLSNHSSCFVKTSMSFINDRLYIQSDRNDKTQIVVENLVSELKNQNKKVIIIDFNGQYSLASDDLKLKVSKNIKLPLNIEAFDTILQYDTTDCPIEDKAVIQSIVLELREYMQTLTDKYIPFDMFKNVVDAEFESNPVSGLMLLRNKLWMYAQDGIFANNKEEFDVINSIFFNQNIIIVDASDIEEKWYKFIIETVSSLTNHNCYLFLSLNDINIDKKSILGLYNKENILPVVSTSYDSNYRPVLMSLCKNYLLCKPSSFLDEQAYYTPLLNRMNNGDFIVYGETTLNLPLVLELQAFDSSTSQSVVDNDIKRDVDKFLSSPQTVIPQNASIASDETQDDDFLADFSDVEAVTGELVVDNSTANLDENIGNSEDFDFDDDTVPLPEEDKVFDATQSDIQDDEFSDSDFDFLDEVSNQNSDDDDILNVPFEMSYNNSADSQNSNYGVFAPVEEETNENFAFVEKITGEASDIVEDVEQINLDEDLDDFLSDIPDVSNVDVSENLNVDNTDEIVENVDTLPETKQPAQIVELPDDILLDDSDASDIVISDDNIQPIADEVIDFDDSDILILDNETSSRDDDVQIVSNNAEELVILDEQQDESMQTPQSTNITYEEDDEELSEAESALDEELASIDDLVDEIADNAVETQTSGDDDIIIDSLDSVEEPVSVTSDEDIEPTVINNADEPVDSDENVNNEVNVENSEISDEPVDEIEDVVVQIPPPQPVPQVVQQTPPPIMEEINTRQEMQNIPVYETDMPNVQSIEDVPFKVGDRVYHPKHGEGVIEAFSSYSNRILFCHILFDNVGRKIMDPRVSCIEKVS